MTNGRGITLCDDWMAPVLYVTHAKGLSVVPVTIENDEFFSDIDISKFTIPPTTNPSSPSLATFLSFKQKDTLKNTVPYKNDKMSYETQLVWNEGGQQITLHLSDGCLSDHGGKLGEERPADDCASIEGGAQLSGSGIFMKWMERTQMIDKLEIRFDLLFLKGTLNLEQQLGRLDFNNVTCQVSCEYDNSLSTKGKCHYECPNGLQGDYRYEDSLRCDDSDNNCTGKLPEESIVSGAAVIEECKLQGVVLPANFAPKIDVP